MHCGQLTSLRICFYGVRGALESGVLALLGLGCSETPRSYDQPRANAYSLATIDVEEDDLAEIDTTNIIEGGRRTRGKKIDFAKAAAEADAMEEDSEDDEDFKAPPEDSEMQQ